MIETYAAAQNLVRRALWPAADAALSAVGEYASYDLDPQEYALTLPVDVREARRIMADVGYHPHPVSALKTSDRGETSRGSWVWRPEPLWRSDRQNHVHLLPDYCTEVDVTHVYVHWETNWWPAPGEWDRPRRHYRPPEKGGSAPDEDPYPYDWAEGQRILEAQLDQAGVEYGYDPVRIP